MMFDFYLRNDNNNNKTLKKKPETFLRFPRNREKQNNSSFFLRFEAMLCRKGFKGFGFGHLGKQSGAVGSQMGSVWPRLLGVHILEFLSCFCFF